MLCFFALVFNIILKLLEQASAKTFSISGDGSTTTILLACQLLKSSLRFLVNGYNAIFLSNGLKRLAYFVVDKVVEYDDDSLLGKLRNDEDDVEGVWGCSSLGKNMGLCKA